MRRWYIISLLFFSALILWHISRPYKLVYLYDNLIWGVGDKVAQERLVDELKRRGIKVETLSSKMNNSLLQFLGEIIRKEKHFTIIQSYISDNRFGIFLHTMWNYNYKFLTLIFASMDFTDDPKIKNTEQLCNAIYKQSHNYKKGKRNVGFVVTTAKKINIDCNYKAASIDFILTWYPTLSKTEFNIQKPKYGKVFYTIGGAWDLKRKSEKYIKFLKNLGDAEYLDLYGPRTIGMWGESTQEYFGKTYKGYLNGGSEIMKISKEYAAVLVLHSDTHTNYKIPSGRIFEAMASGRVIISDENKWVRDNLGEYALYIDIEKSQGEIEEQIKTHMKWIRENPEKAQELASRSHEIFIKNFSLEDQVDKLLARMDS